MMCLYASRNSTECETTFRKAMVYRCDESREAHHYQVLPLFLCLNVSTERPPARGRPPAALPRTKDCAEVHPSEPAGVTVFIVRSHRNVAEAMSPSLLLEQH